MNYFRITAYHKQENYSVILDSYGAFDAIWQFSSFLVGKGFSIFAVNKQERFIDGNIEKVKDKTTKLILRADARGEPKKDGNKISVGDKYYTLI